MPGVIARLFTFTMATLLEDHFSYGKERPQYGKKGDKVTLIATNTNVCIVESKKGNRYPIPLTKLLL